jgi:hypothetical protein
MDLLDSQSKPEAVIDGGVNIARSNRIANAEIMFFAGCAGVGLAILILDPSKLDTIPFWGFVAGAGGAGSLLLYRMWPVR